MFKMVTIVLKSIYYFTLYNISRDTKEFNRRFLMSLQQTTFENILAKGEIAHDE